MISLEFRKKIYKIPLLYKLCLWIVKTRGKQFYKKINNQIQFKSMLIKFHNCAKGKRCFIIGNGPSLSLNDLEKLKGEDCFAANRIFKVFDKTTWRPNYYVLLDRYALNEDEIDLIEAKWIFIGEYFWRTHKFYKENAICFYGERIIDYDKIGFSNDIFEKVYSASTVTYAMIQIAAYMGYSEIFLLGIDHNYPITVDEKGNIVENPDIKSHFFEDNNPKEVVANIVGMTKAYIKAKEYADEHGIKIYNATRGGKLEIFDRVNFDSLF